MASTSSNMIKDTETTVPPVSVNPSAVPVEPEKRKVVDADLTDDALEPLPKKPKTENGTDDIKVIRERNALYSRRSYHRKRMEHKDLEKKAMSLTSDNFSLRRENERLEQLLLYSQTKVLEEQTKATSTMGLPLVSPLALNPLLLQMMMANPMLGMPHMTLPAARLPSLFGNLPPLAATGNGMALGTPTAGRNKKPDA